MTTKKGLDCLAYSRLILQVQCSGLGTTENVDSIEGKRQVVSGRCIPHGPRVYADRVQDSAVAGPRVSCLTVSHDWVESSLGLGSFASSLSFTWNRLYVGPDDGAFGILFYVWI